MMRVEAPPAFAFALAAEPTSNGALLQTWDGPALPPPAEGASEHVERFSKISSTVAQTRNALKHMRVDAAGRQFWSSNGLLFGQGSLHPGGAGVGRGGATIIALGCR